MRYPALQDNPARNFQKNLRAISDALEFSLEDLADCTGISIYTLQSWLQGKAAPSNMDCIKQIANALGTTPHALLGPGKVVARAMQSPPDIEDVYPINLISDLIREDEGEDFQPSVFDYHVGEFLDVIATKLSPRHKRIIELRYREGMSLSEIEEANGVSKSRAGQIVCSAKKILKGELGRCKMGPTAGEMVDVRTQLSEAKKRIAQLEADLASQKNTTEKEPTQTPVQPIGIDFLGLSNRTLNTLRRNGLTDTEKIINFPKNPLHIKGFGTGACNEVKLRLQAYGVDYHDTIWARI